MSKKKIVLLIIALIVMYFICALGLKIDETGFHGILKTGEILESTFITLF
jgi:hypothetical protein